MDASCPAPPTQDRSRRASGSARSDPDGRRPAVRGCLDWTERRPHVAGRLGAHLLDAVLDEGWVSRVPGDRSLRVTESGRAALADARLSRSSPASPASTPRMRHRGSDRDTAPLVRRGAVQLAVQPLHARIELGGRVARHP